MLPRPPRPTVLTDLDTHPASAEATALTPALDLSGLRYRWPGAAADTLLLGTLTQRLFLLRVEYKCFSCNPNGVAVGQTRRADFLPVDNGSVGRIQVADDEVPRGVANYRCVVR